MNENVAGRKPLLLSLMQTIISLSVFQKIFGHALNTPESASAIGHNFPSPVE
jgi:hypothetical protein